MLLSVVCSLFYILDFYSSTDEKPSKGFESVIVLERNNMIFFSVKYLHLVQCLEKLFQCSMTSVMLATDIVAWHVFKVVKKTTARL